MALYSKTTTGLINGVSRQPYALRLESQGYEQVNCLSSISKGVRRRPGVRLRWQATLNAIPTEEDAFHWSDRDPDHRYLVWINSALPSGHVRIIDLLTGNVATPSYGTGAQTYLTSPSSFAARDFLRLLTIGDVTYVVNSHRTPAMGGALTADPAPWAFVWVKAAIAEAKYTVHLKKSGGSAVACEITSSTKTTTEAIATQLAADIDGEADFIAEAIGSLVAIKATSDADFTISTSDGWGDQALVAVKNKSKVQSFAALPPSGVDGMMVEVEGDPETSVDSYYVRFVASGSGAKETAGSYAGSTRSVGTGVWEETAKWNTPYQLDPATMPFKLSFNGSSWSLDPVTWGERTVGDATSAPDPAFVGQPIQDLGFFKNRLAFITGESVALSAVGEYESFFPSTVTTLADDDAFDVTANFPEVAKLRYAIPFNDALVLFSDAGIFGVVGSPDGFTPKTVQFLRLANFTGRVSTRPAMAGDRIFFTEERENETVLREFFQVDRDGVYVVEPVSEHVDDYIAPAIKQIAADGVNGIVTVLSGDLDPPMAWVYQYFHSNREKVQSAWHRWTFSGLSDTDRANWNQPAAARLLAMAIIDGKVYAASRFNDYLTQALDILEMPLSPTRDAGLGTGGTSSPVTSDTNDLIPYVDFWQLVTVTNSSGTAVVNVNGRLNDIAPSPTADIIALPWDVSAGWTETMGEPLAGFTVSNPTEQTTRLSFAGKGAEWNGRAVLVGVRYRSTYEFTPPVLKNGQGVPQLGGRYTLRRARPHFERPATVYAHWVKLPKDTSNPLTVNRRQLYTQKRDPDFPVHRPMDPTLVVGVHSEMPLQGFDLYGVTWELEHVPKFGMRGV